MKTRRVGAAPAEEERSVCLGNIELSRDIAGIFRRLFYDNRAFYCKCSKSQARVAPLFPVKKPLLFYEPPMTETIFLSSLLPPFLLTTLRYPSVGVASYIFSSQDKRGHNRVMLCATTVDKNEKNVPP